MNKNLSKILLLASIGAMPLGMAAQQASSFVFSGKVKDIKGKGIAGVVVNNGRSFGKPILLENGHCLLIPMSASSSVYPLLHPMYFPARRALLKAFTFAWMNL